MQKQKKIIIAFLITPFLNIFANSTSNDEFMQMQKFYYEQGYKEGAKKFYKKGIEDYQNYIEKKVLPDYEARFMAIEATKYLLKESYITFPESYREVTKDGSYKVVIKEPKIERPIRVEELFRMPEKKGAERVSQIDKEFEIKTPTNDNNPSFKNGLKVVDTTKTDEEIPDSVSSIKKQTYLDVSKTKENLNMIEKLNLKYLDSFSGYKIYFENNTQKAEFCYQLTGDSTCSNIN